MLVVTPHPDDETFTIRWFCWQCWSPAATNVQILIYTSDNAGSNDPSMTPRKSLPRSASSEEERFLRARCWGIPKDHITCRNGNYDDGMLEYVDRRELTKQVVREIRRHRPDAVLSIDPGAPYEQWHKSDHRSGAQITVDAMRAAAWRLYFPELEREKGSSNIRCPWHFSSIRTSPTTSSISPT